ncbi:hypothetical protein WJX77_012605 [Trebouxia sp. C0004]
MLLHAGILARCKSVLLPRRPAAREYLRYIACTVRNQERHCFVAPEESATKHLAALLAQDLRAGDCYCLHGDVGAGKSVFSRGFIRSAAEDDELPVPSPTYLLQQIYDDHLGPPIHHFDLYRLDHASGLGRLDLPNSFRHAVTLLEWADKLPEVPLTRLEIHISLLDNQRQANMIPKDGAEGVSQVNTSNEEFAYEDRHWRLICLQPIGTSWAARAGSIAQQILMQQGSHGLTIAD